MIKAINMMLAVKKNKEKKMLMIKMLMVVKTNK
jgi:hypothetical protein